MTSPGAPVAVRKILVPVDGSPDAETVLPLAETLARQAGAEIILLRAPGPDDEVETRAYLAHLTEDQRMQGPVHVRWIAWFDEPVQAIVTAAADLGVDLVAMVTHGRQGARRLFLGSVAEGAVRAASVPVLLVRGPAATGAFDLSRVLVPLDGTAHAEGILEVVERLPAGTGTEMILVQALEPTALPLPTDIGPVAEVPGPEQLAEVQAYLGQVAARLEGQGRRTLVVARAGGAAEVIGAVAHEERAGLIAMRTHGRQGFDRLLLGSVAEQVLRASQCPVLLWRGTP